MTMELTDYEPRGCGLTAVVTSLWQSFWKTAENNINSDFVKLCDLKVKTFLKKNDVTVDSVYRRKAVLVPLILKLVFDI